MTDNMMLTSAKAQHKRKPLSVGKILVYAVLILYTIVIIFPFSVILITSFKTWQDASALEFEWFPSSGFVVEGYKMVFEYKSMSQSMPTLVKSFFNTLLYIIPPTVIGLFTSSLAAYAFAKLQFKAKNAMYAILLATMMIPGTIMIAPQFSIYDTIGWVDTPLPLMIPGMFGAAACVFFMRQFFAGIPDTLMDAAKLDGVGLIGIFFRIIAPLSVPAFIAQGLLGFIGGYNDYFNPLIYLQSADLYNLQVALKTFASAHDKRPNAVMAGTVIALLPTLIIYFFAQEFFIEGIAASGIKG